ncbi:hypothetical protein BCR42DRAFT_419482 [Absidia repens]|uniref:Uncharacterized protein n=1 Tax=Absidia repens TaxID=90262 RepID=A0A1X2IBF6_9FUNG|nr:hypothetical protein BCR42DRAFT_419482 [Absidia repens]
MSVKTSPQSTILVPPSPPPQPMPCDDHGSLTPRLSPTPVAPVVTQNHSVRPPVPTRNRSPPSPTVSPNDHHPHRPSISPVKGRSAMTASPPLTPTPHQPMVTKFISNKKDPLPSSQMPPPLSSASSSTSTKALTSFSSSPSPPLSLLSTATPATNSNPYRQSWYSPFNTGLEFDLLSRSPPSPTHTYASASTSSSPSMSVSSSSFNQHDYRLFSDPPSSRATPPVIPGIGGYNHSLQQPQPQQQPQHIHQLHQYQPHSHSHSSLSLQKYQHRHPHHTLPIQQHHHFQQPAQLCHAVGGGSSYDHPIYGALPTATPPSTQKKPASPIYMESSSSIANLPPPPTGTRLPTPPVSLSPVIAPPSLPPPPSLSSTAQPSPSSKMVPSTFPFSLWYQWKPGSSEGTGQSSALHHQHQHHSQPQQESTCQGNINAVDEQQPATFSLFDRKLSFHAASTRSQDDAPSQR